MVKHLRHVLVSIVTVPVILSAACGDPSPTVKPWENVYTLATVDGQPLPVTVVLGHHHGDRRI